MGLILAISYLSQAFLPPNVPIICVSKGLEVGTGAMMSELIPEALGRKQPAVFLSGPSFAKEVMDQCPTGVVAACKVRRQTDKTRHPCCAATADCAVAIGCHAACDLDVALLQCAGIVMCDSCRFVAWHQFASLSLLVMLVM
jgi:hypothetical protein